MSDRRYVVVVSGSRGWTDKETIRYRLLAANPTQVVQGGAKGADKLAQEVCEEEGIPCYTEHARWERYGKNAGNMRNGKMLSEWLPDEVICFWDGSSTGTENMMNATVARGFTLQVNL